MNSLPSADIRKVVVKTRIHEILELGSTEDLPSQVFDAFIISLILLNVVAVVFETVDTYSVPYRTYFRSFEVISVMIFSVEYGARLWTCTQDERFARPFLGRVRYALTPLALIDLVAVLPFYLPLLVGVDLRILRLMRFFRLFRLFKMGRYSKSVKVFAGVFAEKKEELVISFIVTSMLLVFAASFMHFFEHEAQPKGFSSIPAAMWWGAATLTTVGYGDIDLPPENCATFK
ncbi:MAG: ion transporter [Terriglobia bacterium]